MAGHSHSAGAHGLAGRYERDTALLEQQAKEEAVARRASLASSASGGSDDDMLGNTVAGKLRAAELKAIEDAMAVKEDEEEDPFPPDLCFTVVLETIERHEMPAPPKTAAAAFEEKNKAKKKKSEAENVDGPPSAVSILVSCCCVRFCAGGPHWLMLTLALVDYRGWQMLSA